MDVFKIGSITYAIQLTYGQEWQFKEQWGPGHFCALSCPVQVQASEKNKIKSLLLQKSRYLSDSCSCLSWVHLAWRWASAAGGSKRKIRNLTSFKVLVSRLGLSSVAMRLILNMNTNNCCMLNLVTLFMNIYSCAKCNLTCLWILITAADGKDALSKLQGSCNHKQNSGEVS